MPDLVSIKLAIAHDLAEQVANAEQLAEAANVDGQETTEHAQRFAGGSMLVRNPHPDVERIYPVAGWIRDEQRNGGRIYRRRIVVLEDWTEVEPVKEQK